MHAFVSNGTATAWVIKNMQSRQECANAAVKSNRQMIFAFETLNWVSHFPMLLLVCIWRTCPACQRISMKIDQVVHCVCWEISKSFTQSSSSLSLRFVLRCVASRPLELASCFFPKAYFPRSKKLLLHMTNRTHCAVLDYILIDNPKQNWNST